jgi:16S rRNA (cytidine1402-2'-O)-methyltransferase
MTPAGKLYLVPTPIGNIEDITKRAENILNLVDKIACEDTRHTGLLLNRLGVKKKLISYHEHNERQRASTLAKEIKSGVSIALVSDAGAPGISDPGYRIVREAIQNEIDIVPLPGSNSIIPALTASGLPTDRFFFEGYLPNKSSARQNRLKQLKELEHTLIFFESPFRVAKCLNDMNEKLGNRSACIAREISKMHEEFIRGTLNELLEKVGNRKLKGEFVIVVAGHSFDKKSKKKNDK